MTFNSTNQGRTVLQEPPKRGRPLQGNRVESLSAGSISLDGRNGRMIVSPFHRGIFRVYIQSRHERQAWARDNSWTIDLSPASRSDWTFDETSCGYRYSCELAGGQRASVDIDLAVGVVSCRTDPNFEVSDALAPEVTRKWVLVKKRVDSPGNIHVFGLGGNPSPMDRAGRKVVMWNSSPLIQDVSTTGYQSWPVVIFVREDGLAMGWVFDSPAYARFSFAPDGKQMNYAVKDTELCYYALLGPRLPDVTRQLATLTGKLCPLPKWVMGYHQSRWSYAPSSRLREVATEFRERGIPCDALYLDIDYMDNFKCFTWGQGFEDHDVLINDLHEQGFKVVTILDPALKIERGYPAYESGVKERAFVTGLGGMPVSGKVWAGRSHFPDFLNPAVRDWWAKMVNELASSGIDGIWCDMNEPTTFDPPFSLPRSADHRHPSPSEVATKGRPREDTEKHEHVHNIYGYLMSRATYEGFSSRKNLPFVMTRSAYLGGQKYATTWTGDNRSDWASFRESIPMILNLGLSGQPIVGPDIGGYFGTPTPELYERWILQGALYPYSRTHTRKGTGDQEPWSFGSKVEASARKAIRLRYKLLPYLYSLMYESTLTGEPIARPIFYYDSSAGTLEPEFYETEFLLGPHLLVTPLMDENPTRRCYLPSGRWYSWWSKEEIEGGRIYETDTDKDTDLPLFIRENAIVPTYPQEEMTEFVPDRSRQSLELVVTVDELEDLEGVTLAEDQAQARVVEYFDRDSLLAYDVRFVAGGSGVVGEMSMVREGNVPEEYRPAETLNIRSNHRVSRVVIVQTSDGSRWNPSVNIDTDSRLSDGRAYSLKPPTRLP